jgi:hypothetical protein
MYTEHNAVTAVLHFCVGAHTHTHTHTHILATFVLLRIKKKIHMTDYFKKTEFRELIGYRFLL